MIWLVALIVDVILLMIVSKNIKIYVSKQPPKNAKPLIWLRKGWRVLMQRVLLKENPDADE